MKVEIIKTLKGSIVWKKGTVFDDTVSPIPGDIIKEVKNGSKAVRLITAEKPIAVVEAKTEIKETVENTFAKYDAASAAKLMIPEPAVQGLDGMVDRTMEMAKAQPQEETSKFTFPELEGLIEKNTSVKAVAHLLNVSQQAVSRWRSGKSKPKDKMLKKIKREFKKVKNDQDRTDRPNPI